MVSSETRIARYVVPHTMQTVIHEKNARRRSRGVEGVMPPGTAGDRKPVTASAYPVIITLLPDPAQPNSRLDHQLRAPTQNLRNEAIGSLPEPCATVDSEDFSGDETGMIRDEIRDRVRHVLRLSPALQRNALGNPAHRLGRVPELLCGARCFDRSGRNGIDTDVVASP